MPEPTTSGTTSRTTAIAAAVAVLVVVLAVVLVQVLTGGGDEQDLAGGPGANASGAPAAQGSPSTAAPSAASTSSAPSDTAAAGECTSPPPLPSAPPTFSEVPDASIAKGTTWRATLATSCGDIVLELYGDKAPQTVSSFIFLARQDYWKDSPCHRLVPEGIYVLQCGDPTGTGSGGPGYGYGIENAPADGSYPRGTLAMARTSDPNSNGGQFFIVFKDSQLPVEGGGYSIFGKVVKGMGIVDRIAQAGVEGGAPDGPPQQPISILDVTVHQQRG